MQNEPIEVTLKVIGYLRKWAMELKVSDLLDRALKEST